MHLTSSNLNDDKSTITFCKRYLLGGLQQVCSRFAYVPKQSHPSLQIICLLTDRTQTIYIFSEVFTINREIVQENDAVYSTINREISASYRF